MTEAHKYKLTTNRSKLLENLTVSQPLLNILSEDYTLTADMREDIEVENYQFPQFMIALNWCNLYSVA